ncbi:hypothetical protein [Rugosibacter aromaticivorans]|uniref:hypothetical protein n=1 Tax=Rugosibacter aromaticivorans TaxID=1565605 RepID=UPI00192A51A5|nr:hypothetical protein [Rugosibacter aromaticivorans]
MKQRHVKQLLALSTIYFATSVAIAAGATASGAASGAISATSGETAASSKTVAAGAISGHESAAELVAANRLAKEFETLAGSRENALSLVKGLRNSMPVSLTVSGQSGASGRLVFSPPTQPMGYGEVSRALSLTQAQFAAQGITNPTPKQLQMVLLGEATASGTGKSAQTIGTAGVLQLRSQGMGWSQIAQSLNVSPSGHLAPDAQVSTRASVTGRGNANTSSEGTGINSRAQIDAGARTGLLQGGGVGGGGMGLGIGGAAGVGRGLGLGR